MSHQAVTLWLKISSIIFIIVGILLSWTTNGVLTFLNQAFIDLAVWPVDGGQSYQIVETRLLAAIAGGLTSGFGMAFYMITKHIYEPDPVLGRRIILPSIFCWFIIDGIGSVIAGAPVNAILNISFLILIALPILLASPTNKSVHVQG